MYRKMTLETVHLCDATPRKHPKFLHAPKFIHFSEQSYTQQTISIRPSSTTDTGPCLTYAVVKNKTNVKPLDLHHFLIGMNKVKKVSYSSLSK